MAPFVDQFWASHSLFFATAMMGCVPNSANIIGLGWGGYGPFFLPILRARQRGHAENIWGVANRAP